MPLMLVGILGLAVLGGVVKETGETAEKVGNNSLKLAIAAGVVFYVGKKQGWF